MPEPRLVNVATTLRERQLLTLARLLRSIERSSHKTGYLAAYKAIHIAFKGKVTT